MRWLIVFKALLVIHVWASRKEPAILVIELFLQGLYVGSEALSAVTSPDELIVITSEDQTVGSGDMIRCRTIDKATELDITIPFLNSQQQ